MKVSSSICSVFSVLVVLSLLVSCKEEPQQQWYKGNLHTHSYWSDGNNYPEMIMQWYKDHEYDFVALSDHNILANGEKWINIKKGTTRDSVFQAYLDEFGTDWVEYKDRDSLFVVRLKTLAEYRTLFEESESFLILKAEEITDGFEDKPVHVNATNIQDFIEPRGGGSVYEVMQNNIDAVLEQRELKGEPIIPHINHPNFGWAVTAEDLKKLEGEQFFEVYNGHPQVHNYGDSLRSGTEQMWDEVITHYLIEGKPVMYGIAVDDAHNYHEFNTERANPGRGWIYVKSSVLSPDSLITAMERGDFYGSNGVRLSDIQFDGSTLSIEINGEEGVSYTTQFIGTRSKEPSATGVLFDEVEGTSVSYTLSGDELYVRAKIESDKRKENPFKEGEVEVAWTQPVGSE